MSKLHKIWKDKDVTMQTKRRLVEALAFPVALFGSVTWVIRKDDRRRIDAFGIWCWRRMMRTSWEKRVTNREVLERVKSPTSLEARITRLKLRYFGHVMRKENSLERKMMLDMMEGSRRRGRQQRRWMDDVQEDTGMELTELTVACARQNILKPSPATLLTGSCPHLISSSVFFRILSDLRGPSLSTIACFILLVLTIWIF